IMGHVERMPAAITPQNSRVPAAFAELIEKRLLAKRPEDRFQTPGELAAALRPWTQEDRAAEHLVPLAGKPSLPATPRRPLSTRRIPLFVAIGLLLLAGGSWLAGQIIVRIRDQSGKGTEITVPAGSKVTVGSGRVEVTPPADGHEPRPDEAGFAPLFNSK